MIDNFEELLKSHIIWLESNGERGRQAVFRNETIENTDIEKLELRGAVFDSCNFLRIHFDEVQFAQCEFLNCSFSYSNFRSTVFSHSVLDNCSFEGAYIANCTLIDSRMQSCYFMTAKMHHIDFLECESIDAVLKFTELSYCSVENVKDVRFLISNCTLSQVDPSITQFFEEADVDSLESLELKSQNKDLIILNQQVKESLTAVTWLYRLLQFALVLIVVKIGIDTVMQLFFEGRSTGGLPLDSIVQFLYENNWKIFITLFMSLIGVYFLRGFMEFYLAKKKIELKEKLGS